MPTGLFWDSIKEGRANYFVEYKPPVADTPFATLFLIFPSEVTAEVVVRHMEEELELWLSRYKVPLMVMAFDSTEKKLPRGNSQSEYLVGYRTDNENELIKKWGLASDVEFPAAQLGEAYLKQVYFDIPLKTQEEIRERVYAEARKFRTGHRILLALFLAWATVPVAIELLGFAHPWIGVASFCYGLYKFGSYALDLFDLRKPSKKKLAEQEKKRMMEHYYYHCERNPMGFAELKSKNFLDDVNSSTIQEAQKLGVKV